MLVVSAAITTTKGTVEIVYPPYLAGYGYTLSLIGFLTALIAVLQLVSRLPIGVAYRSDRVKRQLALALVAFAISTSGFAFAAGAPLAVAALSILHGFAFGSTGTLGLALAIDVSGGRRAGVSMAWYTAANSTGYALGALIGGTLADARSRPPRSCLRCRRSKMRRSHRTGAVACAGSSPPAAGSTAACGSPSPSCSI